MHERQVFGRSILLVRQCRSRSNSLRSARCARPSIADLFVAVMDRRPQTGGRDSRSSAAEEEQLDEYGSRTTG